MKPIAHIRPIFLQIRQTASEWHCGNTQGTIVIEPEYRKAEAIRGIEGFSSVAYWQFSEALNKGWTATVRPPRLGAISDGRFCHTFALSTNSLGLSSVVLESVKCIYSRSIAACTRSRP
jgi:tRNA (Thr-GGU) A37 N-methylase